jgi:hypothetical protein
MKCDHAAKRVTDDECRITGLALDKRREGLNVRIDAPWRRPRRPSMPNEIRRDDSNVGQMLLGKRPPASTMSG